MDKTAIKTFAINSRKKLMEDVEYKMSLVGISKNCIDEPISSAKGIETFNFGKYKGQHVLEVLQKDPGYYSWILQGDFSLNTKNVLTKIRLKNAGLTK